MYNQMLSDLINHDNEDEVKIIDDLFEQLRKDILRLNPYERNKFLISNLNFAIRSQYKSSELVGIKVRKGDVCFIDFGPAYINEAGYQHFGVIIGYCNSKAFVVPMSSNSSMYYQSYDEKDYPVGKKHLYRLPELKGLHKKSVLFLNDAKYINTARVISVKAHIDPESDLFKDILKRTLILIIDNDDY